MEKRLLLTVIIISAIIFSILLSIFIFPSINKDKFSGIVDHKVIGGKTSDTSFSILKIMDSGISSSFNEDVNKLLPFGDNTPIITKSIEEEIINIYTKIYKEDVEISYAVQIVDKSDGTPSFQYRVSRNDFNSMTVGESYNFEAYTYFPYEIIEIFE